VTQYKLPDLPYDYNALEPHISADIMRLHHDKHHAAYVTNANKALETLTEMREKNQFDRIPAVERALAFNVSGHVLHSIFWRNLKPKAAGTPSGELATAINRDFGNFDKFKTQLTQATGTIMGSGWGALVYEPMTKKLNTVQVYDHQSNLTQAGVPLLVIDAWEHAFYLQYKNEKGKFFEAVWNVINWDDVGGRFTRAQKLDLDLPGTIEG
jgi:Fe-Mn family superoxide dismutase